MLSHSLIDSTLGDEMADGEIIRLFAFQVTPKQVDNFRGGSIILRKEITDTLKQAYVKEHIAQGSLVVFKVQTSPTQHRQHLIRDSIMELAFSGKAKERSDAALAIAATFGASMDDRSPGENLLLLSVHRTNSAKNLRVVLWTFPQEEVFKLDATKKGNLLLQDAFVPKSNFRKMASFEGGRTPAGFTKGRVLDPQSGSRSEDIAQFWLEKFLNARLEISTQQGISLLSRALSDTYNKSKTIEEKGKVLRAIVGLGSYNGARLSVKSVGDDFLEPAQRKILEAQVPDEETHMADFLFDKDLFAREFPNEIFELEGGVVVSAPLVALQNGATLTISEPSEDGHQMLTLTGRISSTKLRRRAKSQVTPSETDSLARAAM